MPVFDAIIGRNALTRHPDKAAAATMLASLLAAAGVISLAETVPSRTQRLYKLVDLTALGDDLAGRVMQAEEAIYSRPDDPMVNWNEDDLRAAFSATGLHTVVEIEHESSEVQVTAEVLARWFTASAATGQSRPSYADHLRSGLSEDELAKVSDLFRGEASQPAGRLASQYSLRARPFLRAVPRCCSFRLPTVFPS